LSSTDHRRRRSTRPTISTSPNAASFWTYRRRFQRKARSTTGGVNTRRARPDASFRTYRRRCQRTARSTTRRVSERRARPPSRYARPVSMRLRAPGPTIYYAIIYRQRICYRFKVGDTKLPSRPCVAGGQSRDRTPTGWQSNFTWRHF
jgi:hypothetical protein